MGYRNTVRCSYCGGRGHNRAGCPQRKKDAEANPESWDAKRLKAEQEKRQRAVENRRCSYCNGDSRGGKITHNRRGCKLRKLDIKKTESLVSNYRRDLLKEMQKVGLGVGSLLSVPAGDRLASKIVYLVTGIDWGNITHRLAPTDLLGFQSESGPHTPWRYTAGEQGILRCRVVSHDIPEDEIKYWQQSWLRPMGEQFVGLNNILLGNLTRISENETVKIDYHEYPREVAQVRIIGKICQDKVKQNIPADWMDGKFSNALLNEFSFDTEGWRKVKYEHKEEQ
jgi:hypothetical protein